MKKPHQMALQVIKALGFDTEVLTKLGEKQSLVEQDITEDPTKPSSDTSAELFAITARLSGNLNNEQPLSVIGAQYGTYLYLIDAFRDFPKDMLLGQYNPLKSYSCKSGNLLILENDGLKWLLNQLKEVQSKIHEYITQIHFYQYADIVSELICKPIDEAVIGFSELTDNQGSLTFKKWDWLDIIKSATFTFSYENNGQEFTKLSPVVQNLLSSVVAWKNLPKADGGCGDCGGSGGLPC